MPLIYSPGEAEVRPLDPDAIVYTTAQKVADILGVGPSEAVLVAQDSTANAVYVTGADFRDHGFEVGDTILIYSDADPLGNSGSEYKITSIATNSPGIQLNFAETITHANFQVADNTYVQNTASFTNGKTRGMKKSIVEQRIKEIQDRIDSVTHNAWRPYRVVGEYINFDTYKPYRRRYYTDYVGTTPLLFRNIQQMLRIELWQGDDYRELAGAEGRLEIVDHTGLLGDSIYLHLGAGATPATLTAGTGNNQWRVDFDRVTTAQNLADLINKDSRRGKAAIDFSGVTLEDSTSTTGTSQLSVHHEFLASANADYGSGKIKLTSNRAQGGGETVSIASSDLTNLEISQITPYTTTVGVHRTTLEVLGAFAYPIGWNTTILVSADASAVLTIGDTVYNANHTEIGVITAMTTVGVDNFITIGAGTKVALVGNATPGTTTNEYLYTSRLSDAADTSTLVVSATDVSGFNKNGGLLMIVNGDTTRVVSYTSTTTSTVTYSIGEGSPMPLAAQSIAVTVGKISGITELVNSFKSNTTKGTEVTQYRLGTDLGFISGTSGDKARLKDWWMDSEMGIIYFNNSYPFFEWNAVKVSYIYGERYVEKAIEEAATKMVASDLLMSDDRSVLIPEGTQNVDLASKIQLWRKEAEAIINRYKEVVVFD